MFELRRRKAMTNKLRSWTHLQPASYGQAASDTDISLSVIRFVTPSCSIN